LKPLRKHYKKLHFPICWDVIDRERSAALADQVSAAAAAAEVVDASPMCPFRTGENVIDFFGYDEVRPELY
jgi:hypothetical protein